MKTIKLSLCLLAALLIPRFASALITGPYTPDANTLFLLHFDAPTGGSVVTNYGLKGGNFYTVTNTTSGNGLAEPPPVTTLLGFAGYTNSNGTNFGNASTCTNNDGLADGLIGYDGNKNGAYDADVQNEPASPDAISITNLNIGNGNLSPFTLEALICPTIITVNQEIISTDDYNGTRGFQFKITSTGQLQFNLIGVGSAASFNIPTSGTHAFVAGRWYHVAAVYNGSTVTLYWTQLDPSNTVANAIGSVSETYNASTTVAPLDIGGENRGSEQESFQGLIDEVRISSVARAANGMEFYSPTVTISPNPASQNVDDNQPVTFTVNASSLTALGYQWRFNGTPIPGATAFGTNTSSYSIASVDLTNAGNYDCVVTNISGNSATSSPAILVVGAANFLKHRYSFTTDTSDSIGGATGTNFGDAAVSGGSLVLDGTTGTYMQLPGGLFQGVQAATFDFWASYGTISGNNEHVFDFGNTNGIALGVPGQPNNYLFFSPHSGTVNRLTGTPGTSEFEQTASATGILDGQTLHVTCVVDPPDNYLAIYTNGVLEVADTNYTIPFASLSDQLAYVGRSLFADLNGDAYLEGSIDEFRIYNGALSAASVLQSDLQGTGSLLSDGPVQLAVQPVDTSSVAGLTVTFTGAATGHLPFTYQWFENGSPIAGATNTSYSFVASSGQNGHTFQFVATNNIAGTNYFAASTNATLTLINPPTLTWLGAADNLWNTISLDWSNTSPASVVAFANLDGVLFNDLGGGQPDIDVTEAVSPHAMTVDSATATYGFYSSGQDGSLTGSGSLTKNNSGTLIIDLTNNMSGPTLISGGVLQIGYDDSFGTLGSGPVTNNGTLSLDRSDTALTVPNTIHGTGTLSIDGAGTVTISGTNDFTGNTLINQGILILQSSTGLGATNGSITVGSANNAELYITANVDIGNKPLILGGSGSSSAGALRKGGAGTTTYSGPVTLTADTTLNVDGGATLNLTNASGLNGTSANASLTLDGSGAGNIAGPLLFGSGSLTVSGGTWTVASTNNFSGLTTISGGQLKITGPLSLGPVPGSFNYNQVTLSGGTLGCATNVTLNDGNIGIDLSANSTLSADANATFTISNQISSDSSALILTKTGAGRVVLSGPNPFNGTLYVDTFSQTANDGTLVIASTAAIANIPATAGTPSISIRNQNSGSSTLGLDGTLGGVTVAPDINLNGRNNAVPSIDNIAGNNTISGNFTLGAGGGTYMIQSDGGTLALTAPLPYATPNTARTFTFAGAGNISVADGIQNGSLDANSISNVWVSVIKTGSGTLSLPVANAYSGSTTISNGVLLLNGSITSLGGVVVVGGAAATLSGTGSIADNVTVQSGGTISPGAGTNSVGALTISGNLTNNGTLLMDLNKSGATLTSDLITGAGTLQYGGTLQLVLNGSALAVGDSFTLFSAGSRVGAFTNIVPATPGSGLAWNTNALGSSGVLGVMAGTAPLTGLKFTSNPVISGTSLAISATNTGAGTFYLLTSTNIASPISTWTPVWTNTAGGSGTVTTNLSNAVNPALGQQFYILSTTNNN